MSQTPKRPPDERSSFESSEKKQKKGMSEPMDVIGVDSSSRRPSKVLHVRNLPPDCTEQELVTLANPFGRVTGVLILKGKNQAFIEMAAEPFAASLIEYYNSVQASIRLKPVFFQYSTRSELSSTSEHEPVSSVLLVTVLNLVYPITIEILHQIFSRYGIVQKIVIFQKKAGFQSLIQFAREEEASAAKKALDGQNIYSGCCTLRVQYSSNVQELNVKVNNDKSRDYINNILPAQPLLPPFQQVTAMDAYPTQPQQTNPVQYNNNTQMTNASNQQQNVCFVRNLEPERITPDILFTLFGVYGNVIRVKILFHKPNNALIQFENPSQCQAAIHYLSGCPLHGKKLLLTVSTNQSISFQKGDEESERYTKEYTNSPLHRFRVEGSKNFSNIAPPSPALHVSNLDPHVSEDVLRRLFSNYGNIVSMKMFTANNSSSSSADRKMASIQMEDTAQAVEALVNLHNYRFENSATFFRVSFSKHYHQR